MRLLYLVIGLAILLWVIYTYQSSNTANNADSDKTVKQQLIEQKNEAKSAASALQKSLDEQAKRLQQSTE